MVSQRVVSRRQLEANQANAMKSTGPHTAEGLRAVAVNATRHGIWSKVDVVPEFESRQDWEDHLAATVADWSPCGYMEEVLTEQIALLLWRLQRVARYEREAIAVSLEIDPREAVKEDLGPMGERKLEIAAMRQSRSEEELIAESVSRCKRSRLLPPDGQSEKIRRYEAHLERLLHRAMHELQRRQAARTGRPVMPPVAIDIDLPPGQEGA
jgi:hypothetical protein